MDVIDGEGDSKIGNSDSKPHTQIIHLYGQTTVISNFPRIYLEPVDRSPDRSPNISMLDLGRPDIPGQQNKNFSYKP